MTEPHIPSDDELLRLIRAGDEQAFASLYGRRQGGIYRFALRMSGSETVAEDVTQEVFLALMDEGGQYDGDRGPLASYLYGIARNQVLRRLERDRFYVPMNEGEGEEVNIAPSQMVAPSDPLGDLTRLERIESVRAAVLALPAHYREVVVLCEMEEMSYAEAAAVLGCAVGTVRSRLHRARSILAEKLRALGEAEAISPEVNPTRCFA